MLLTPLEWLERLAVLVPAPRVQLLTSHGVLAPHAAWRAAIVPAPVVGAPAAETGRADPEPPRPPGRRSGTALLRRVFALEGLTCPRWGGPRRVVAAVTEPPRAAATPGRAGARRRAPAAPARPRRARAVRRVPGSAIQAWPPQPAVGCAAATPLRPGPRPPEIFGKNVTLHYGPSRPSHLLLPIIPPKE